MTKLLVALVVALIAVSCAAVRTNIAVTHTLSSASAAKTVAIVPYEPGLGSAPDYQSSVAKLAAHLEASGFDVVAPAAAQTADYIAFFHYGVDGELPVNVLVSRPLPVTGSLIPYRVRAPFSPGTRPVYRRTVILEIVDRARFNPNEPRTYIDARLYSGWVKSDGACSTMAPVIDPMLAALFSDFPGESGELRTIDLRADSACGLDRYG
jgi:hypothetical protein